MDTRAKGLASFLESSMGWIFDDLPEKKDDFIASVQKIKTAFQGTLSDNDPDFSQLKKCVQTPNSFLLGLENSAPNTSISEARNGLLDLATQKLKAASQKTTPPINHFESVWDEKSIHATFSQNHAAFETQKPKTESPEHLYSLQTKPHQIFSGWIDEDENLEIVNLNLSIEVKDNEKKLLQMPFSDMPEFDDDEDDEKDDFFTQTSKDAYERAVTEAADVILDKLAEEKIIDADDKSFYEISKEILTFKPYLEGVRKKEITPETLQRLYLDDVGILTNSAIVDHVAKKKLPFNEAKKIKRNEIQIYENPGLVNLLFKKICSINDLWLLSENQVQVACDPYYNSLLMSGSLKLKHLLHLKDKHCKNLLFTPCINLQKKLGNKITIKQVAQMSTGAKKLSSHEFYYNLLLQEKITFASIAQIDEAHAILLLQQNIINLIGQEIIPKEAIANLKGMTLKKCSVPLINKALLKKEMSYQEVTQLTVSSVQLLAKDPLIYQLYQQKFIKLLDINKIQIDYDEFPDEAYQPRLLSRNEYSQYPQVLKDYLALANAGVLHINDLHYIHDEPKSLKDYKPDAKGNGLHKLLDIQERCEINVVQRLLSLIHKKPMKLNGQLDSLQKLHTDCNQFQINLKALSWREMEKFILQLCLRNSPMSLKELVGIGTFLGFKDTETVGLFYGLRLFYCFLEDPFKNKNNLDSIEDVANAIKKCPSETAEYMIKHFLIKIKDFINQKRLADEENIYKEIYKVICRSELQAQENENASQTTKLFSHTLEHIFKRVKNSLQMFTILQFDVERPSKKARNHYSLWQPNTLTTTSGKRGFCQKLTQLTDCILIREAKSAPTPRLSV